MEKQTADIDYLRRVLIGLSLTAAFVLSLLFFIYTFQVLLVIFAGMVVSVPISWFSDQIHRTLRIPRTLALILVTLVIILAFSLMVIPTIPLLAEQAIRLAKSIPRSLEELRLLSLEFSWASPISETLKNPLVFLNEESLDWGKLMSRVTGFFSDTLGIVVYTLMVLLIAVYLAADPEMYTNGFIRLFPVERRSRIRFVIRELGYTLRWWLFGQSISMTILGVSTTLFLWIMGVPLALFLGLFTAVMTFIPNIGPIIAGIPTVLIALTEGPIKAFFVLIFYVILQNIEGVLITPNIHQRIIALPPVLIISAQVILSAMVGAVGVILAMPLVACGMVLVRRFYIEDVLGDDLQNKNLKD